MQDTPIINALPEGYAGNFLIELEEEKRREDELAVKILQRARSLAWQAVRYTPSSCVCADICMAWIRQAQLWASRRYMADLASQLSEILERLELCLPILQGSKYKQ